MNPSDLSIKQDPCKSLMPDQQSVTDKQRQGVRGALVVKK